MSPITLKALRDVLGASAPADCSVFTIGMDANINVAEAGIFDSRSLFVLGERDAAGSPVASARALATSAPALPPTSVPLAGAVAEGDATAARDDGLSEFDPPLGLFLARLGLMQHLPVLVEEEMSLALLKRLSADELHTNLAAIGLKRGACCEIILGLRGAGDDGGASSDFHAGDVGGGDEVAASVVATAVLATAASAAAPTTADGAIHPHPPTTEAWRADGAIRPHPPTTEASRGDGAIHPHQRSVSKVRTLFQTQVDKIGKSDISMKDFVVGWRRSGNNPSSSSADQDQLDSPSAMVPSTSQMRFVMFTCTYLAGGGLVR